MVSAKLTQKASVGFRATTEEQIRFPWRYASGATEAYLTLVFLSPSRTLDACGKKSGPNLVGGRVRLRSCDSIIRMRKPQGLLSFALTLGTVMGYSLATY
jgi:hypothetical protein